MTFPHSDWNLNQPEKKFDLAFQIAFLRNLPFLFGILRFNYSILRLPFQPKKWFFNPKIKKPSD